MTTNVSYRKIYASIFFIAFATLLLEITLTRIYSVILFYNFAFMIISTALFGYGMSAVWLTLFYERIKTWNILPWSSFLFALAIVILMTSISFLPVSFSKYHIISRIILMTIHYLVLIIPFFMSGLFVSCLFIQHPAHASKLYFFDLVAAALGSLAMLALISKVGAPGLLMVACGTSLISCLLLVAGLKKKLVLALAIVLLFWMTGRIEHYFPVEPHASKIGYHHHRKNNKIVLSQWSAVTKIDIARDTPLWIIWIDGGTNQSFMPVLSNGKSVELSYKDITSIPYKIKNKPKTLIIGAGGGWEVQVAKDLNASSITAVEMDGAMVNIVKNRFIKELNYLFDNPDISLIANEGRSYLHSTKETFDIIQEINNQTSIAIASGALNLSETFLLTREALHLYLERLTEDGILSIWKWGIERMFTSAIIVMQEYGISHPEHHMFIIKHKDHYQRLFLLKKSPFTSDEINSVELMCKEHNWEILFNPGKPHLNPLFSQLLDAKSIKTISQKTGLDLLPATDNKPFFNHFMPFWHLKVREPELLSEQLVSMIENVSRTERFTLGVLFIQSIIFSILFLFFPLIRFSKKGIGKGFRAFTILYFSCLGIGFIFIEIVLMQKFVLYLGHPSYSISIILFSLLVSAGIGSYLSEHLRKRWGDSRFIKYIFSFLLIAILPHIFLINPLINATISLPIIIKGIITFVFIFMLGTLLGMPFPTGLYLIQNESKTLVGWAWAINAYMTVVGSMLSIAIALSFGFKIVVILSFLFYCIAWSQAARFKK